METRSKTDPMTKSNDADREVSIRHNGLRKRNPDFSFNEKDPLEKFKKMSDMVTQNISLQGLPDEILLKIFGYLSMYDNVLQIGLVCKRFQRISRDSIEKLEISKPKNKYRAQIYVYEALQHYKFLKTLTLTNRKDTDFLISAIMPNCPKLEDLRFFSCKMNEDCAVTIGQYGQNLKVLMLFNCTDTQDQRRHADGHDFWKKMKNLEELLYSI